MNNYLIDDELQIVRYSQGIKLVRPECVTSDPSLLTVGRLKASAFSLYFLDADSCTQSINEEGAKVCGFDSANNAIGKTLLEVSKTESANHLINNCSSVIHDNAIKIFEEENLRKDNVMMQFLSIKSPWYNDDNKIIGILGCSIVLGQHSLANSLSEIGKLGLLDQHSQTAATAYSLDDLRINNIYLSNRELECLRLTVKGYTAKRIARELAISHRTVEEYLYNIRMKTGASSKSELIEMTLDNFMRA